MKKDLKSLKSFFCLFQTQWVPYIIATLIVASRNFVITYINAMISSQAIAIVSSKTAAVESILKIVIGVVCFAAIDAVGVYSQTTVIHKISVILREKMFNHALSVSVSDIDLFGRREELVSRMNLDINNAAGLLSYGLLSPIMCFISGIGATVIVFKENWRIGAAIYCLGLLAFAAQIFFSKRIRKYMTRIQEERSAIFSVSMQTFSSSAGIKMAGMSDYVAGMHRSGIKRYTGIFSKKGVADGAFGMITGALQLASFFGVFCYGLFGAGMELEKVVFISQMTPLIATMILSLSGCVANVQRSMAGIDRILELFRLPVEEDAGEEFIPADNEPKSEGPWRMSRGSNTPSACCGVFDVRQAGMETHGLICRYRDNEVRIADIDIPFGNGNLIALKGPSGCGKTTLLRLLLKLYPYAEGTFKFFGQDIAACSRRSVRNSIAYVPQENIIFPGTVRENILLGNPRGAVTDEEIWSVLQQVGADEWIEKIGLDSTLKEDGVNLSGGQRQMIAVARAILYRKPVLVLDEAFASVDEEHIGKMMDLLSAMQQDVYVIIVTHDNHVMLRCSAVVDLQAVC